MHKFRSTPDSVARPLVDIQVSYCPHPAPGRIELWFGHQGTGEWKGKSWPTVAGSLDASQLSDISTYVARLVDESVVGLLTIRGLPAR